MSRRLVATTVKKPGRCTAKLTFREGRTVTLRLPSDLTPHEAKQLGILLDTLATDGRRLDRGQILKLKPFGGAIN